MTLHDWQSCVHEPEDMPERGGRVWVGFDAGSSASMSAWVALWESGRMEAWAALPSVPDLRTRGKQDGVGSLYLSMQAGGELVTYGGRVTPVAECVRVMADSPGSRKRSSPSGLTDIGVRRSWGRWKPRASAGR